MKDRQVKAGDSSGHIPVVSPVLHFVAMTGIVFLRSSFGIVFLRHKSVFLAFGYAQLLFTIYACLEPGVFARHRAEVIYGTTATLLYIAHLLITVAKETRRIGEHDQYSGTSHLLRFVKHSDSAEMKVQLWIEPALVLIVSVVLHFFPGCGGIANWLTLVAVAMCGKEVINYWFQLRRSKRQEDIFDDTREAVDDNPSGAPSTPPLKSSRKSRVKRPRACGETENRPND